MRPTPYVASLRIYEPLSAFDPVDRLRWTSIDPEKDSRTEEQSLALRRIIFPEPPAGRPDGAHILDVDGLRYVSPWSTANRCWAALDDFKDSMPSSVTKFFVPESLEDVITAGVEQLEDKVPHILTETWVIPPRWFSLFMAEERVRGIDNDGHYTLMRAKLSDAKARCQVAHQTVQRAFGPGPVEGEIEELEDWLDLFHPQSLIELDYGGLANYLDRALRESGESGLDADSSIEDVLSSLAGLAAGDGSLAGQGYERLVSRWRKVAAYESAM